MGRVGLSSERGKSLEPGFLGTGQRRGAGRGKEGRRDVRGAALGQLGQRERRRCQREHREGDRPGGKDNNRNPVPLRDVSSRIPMTSEALKTLSVWGGEWVRMCTELPPRPLPLRVWTDAIVRQVL